MTNPDALLGELLDADAAALAAHEKLRDHENRTAVVAATVKRLRQALQNEEPDATTELAVQRLLEICGEIPTTENNGRDPQGTRPPQPAAT